MCYSRRTAYAIVNFAVVTSSYNRHCKSLYEHVERSTVKGYFMTQGPTHLLYAPKSRF